MIFHATHILVEQDLLTVQHHLSSSLVFGGLRVTQSLLFGVVFIFRSLFVIFLLAIVLSAPG
jgi:hypothetical protein